MAITDLGNSSTTEEINTTYGNSALLATTTGNNSLGFGFEVAAVKKK